MIMSLLTLAANHTSWVVELVQARLCDLVKIQGPLDKLIGRDELLESFTVDERLAGRRWRNRRLLRVVVKQRLLESRGGCAVKESGRKCSEAHALEASHLVGLLEAIRGVDVFGELGRERWKLE